MSVEVRLNNELRDVLPSEPAQLGVILPDYPNPEDMLPTSIHWWNRKIPRKESSYDPTDAAQYTTNATVKSILQADNTKLLDDHFMAYMDGKPDVPTLTRRSLLHSAGKLSLVGTLRSIQYASLTGIGLSELLKTDQAIGEFIWPSTKPLLHELPMTSKTTDLTHGTFVFGGYGVKNAAYIAEALQSSLGSTGSILYGIEYDNAGLQIDDLTTAVLKEIDDKTLTELSVYGHSMGGDVALLVMVNILKRRPNLHIRTLFLDCTPVNMNVVRATERGGGEFMSSLAARLNLYGGPITRMGFELANSHLTLKNPFASVHNPLNINPFMTELQNDVRIVYDRMDVVMHEKFNGQAMSNRLGIDEFDGIRAMDVDAVFGSLADYNGRQLIPLAIRYLRPKKGELDTTIDVDASQTLFAACAKKFLIDFAGLDIASDRAHHADPHGLPELYNPLIRSFLQQQEAERVQIIAKAYPNMMQSLFDALTRRRNGKVVEDQALDNPPVVVRPTH